MWCHAEARSQERWHVANECLTASTGPALCSSWRSGCVKWRVSNKHRAHVSWIRREVPRTGDRRFWACADAKNNSGAKKVLDIDQILCGKSRQFQVWRVGGTSSVCGVTQDGSTKTAFISMKTGCAVTGTASDASVLDECTADVHTDK